MPLSTVPPTDTDVLLADGRVATLRPMTVADLPALTALHEGAGEDALRLRFFSSGNASARAYLEHLRTSTDTVAWVAVLAGEVVALATGEPLPDGSEEVAFLVGAGQRGHGLGTLLLEHLAAGARARGVRLLVAEVLVENHPMLEVFLDAGFEVGRHTVAGVVQVELDPQETTRSRAAVEAREARAEAHSLRPLLHPRSLAVVGVRRDGSGIGAGILRSVREADFTGRVSVLHPVAREVLDTPAYPSLAEVPFDVDLLVVAVPGEAAVTAVQQAAAAGVGAAVVISSGFEELGDDGGELQRRLLEVARDGSVRLVGPNCLGLLVHGQQGCLNATFQEQVPTAGGLAVASQSGGVGIVLMDLASRLGLGIGSFVSLGNKADVSGNDLLAAWREDPEVTAAALYLESFGNARKFARLARRFSLEKPLLAVVGGRSDGGQRAGASHTAAAASSRVGLDAVFADAGVIGCDSAEQLAATALVLAEQPRPRGRRLGVLSNAGGMGVLAADAADGVGLEVPVLSPHRAARIAQHVSGTVGTGNPVDAGAAATGPELAATATELLADDAVDAVLVVLVATGVTDATEAVAELTAARARAGTGKPLLLVTFGGVELPGTGTPGMTLLPSIDDAVGALARVARYEEWRALPVPELPPADPARAHRARRWAAELLGTTGGGFLGHVDQTELLAAYGLSPEGESVTGPGSAGDLAAALGEPVAVKIDDPAIVHKTDLGLVRTRLVGREQVAMAVAGFRDVLEGREPRVVVQPMRGGVELAVGLLQDPSVGPLVMVAAGGVNTDLWNDRRFLLAPVTRDQAERALRSLRSWPLLDGYRGSARAAVEDVVDLLVSVGQLAVEVPEVAEMDLNPVLVGERGVHLVDVKARVAPAPEGPDGTAHLRPRGIPRREA